MPLTRKAFVRIAIGMAAATKISERQKTKLLRGCKKSFGLSSVAQTSAWRSHSLKSAPLTVDKSYCLLLFVGALALAGFAVGLRFAYQLIVEPGDLFSIRLIEVG